MEKEGGKGMREEMAREEGGKGREARGRERGRERTNSTGVLEMFRRKRELEGEGDSCFQRSKITPRCRRGGRDVMRALEGWMNEFKGRWERLEESMEGIRRELGEMRRREDEWRRQREGMEKRIGELEARWEKGLRLGEGGKKLEELEERIKAIEKGGVAREGKGGAEVEERVKRLEREREMRERRERRNNVVIKGFKEEGGDARKGGGGA